MTTFANLRLPFTVGSLVFIGPSGEVAQDNAKLFWDNVNDFFSIGHAVPVGELHVLTTSTTNVFRGMVSDQVSSSIQGGLYSMRKARGTPGALVAVSNGDFLGGFEYAGHDGTNYLSRANIRGKVVGVVSAGTVPVNVSIGTGSSGAAADRFTIDSLGNVVIGLAALATTATDGFLYIPTTAGAPTGTPTTYTGRVAMVFDTTNDKLMIFDGAWIGVTLA